MSLSVLKCRLEMRHEQAKYFHLAITEINSWTMYATRNHRVLRYPQCTHQLGPTVKDPVELVVKCRSMEFLHWQSITHPAHSNVRCRDECLIERVFIDHFAEQLDPFLRYSARRRVPIVARIIAVSVKAVKSGHR